MSLTLPKAILFVRKPFSEAPVQENEVRNNESLTALRDLVKKKGGKSAASLLNQTAKAAASQAGQVASAAEGLTNALTGKNDDDEAKAKTRELVDGLTAGNYRAMTVQYNPRSIRYDATAGGIYRYQTGPGDQGANNIATSKRATQFSFSVQLVFDKVNNMKAFNVEQQASVSVNTIVSGISALAQNETLTVQPQVEGLIAMMQHKTTRDVIFVWANMFFHGEMTRVNSKYTMFDGSGNPIRAVVDLTMWQADSKDKYKSDFEYWDTAFSKAFGEAGTTAESGMGTFEKLRDKTDRFLNF